MSKIKKNTNYEEKYKPLIFIEESLNDISNDIMKYNIFKKCESMSNNLKLQISQLKRKLLIMTSNCFLSE